VDRDGRFVPNCNSFFPNDSATVCEGRWDVTSIVGSLT